MAPELDGWARPAEGLASYVAEESEKYLSVYRDKPQLVTEHANIERATA
jgi:hypothetical protein